MPVARHVLPRLRWLLCASLACATLLSAVHATERTCLPKLREGWVRLPPVSMPMLAGFGYIENACNAPARIVAASSPGFGSVELHESTVVDGISRMRAVPVLQIASRGKARMQPGGLHLMLMRPRRPLAVGDKVTVEFELADGRGIRGEFQVRGPGTR